MEIDEKFLAQLRALDDDSLRELIGTVTEAMGGDEKTKRAALAQTGRIRRKLSRASREDLQKAIDSFGKEEADRILGKMKG